MPYDGCSLEHPFFLFLKILKRFTESIKTVFFLITSCKKSVLGVKYRWKDNIKFIINKSSIGKIIRRQGWGS